MIPASFEYHVPTTLEDAIALLEQYGDEAKLLAGGHSLLPMMKLRFAEPEHLIDLNRIETLRGIQSTENEIVIGAMTCENALIDSELLRARCPLLPEAAKLIADPQVRNRGTIGGDIAHGDPANDQPALMLALDAKFTLSGPDGSRVVPASEFFLGTYFTQLAENEVLTEIHIAPFSPNMGGAYQKLKRKTGDFATAAVAAVLRLSNGVCEHARIALTNLAPCAIRSIAAEEILTGNVINEDLIEQAAQAVMSDCDPAEDLRGDVEYKTHMGGEMARRAIRLAHAQAEGV